MLSPKAQNPPSVFFLLSTLKPRKFQLSSAFRFLSSSLTFSCSLSSSSQISTQLILYNLGKSVGSPPLSQLSHQVHLLSFSQLPHLNILYPNILLTTTMSDNSVLCYVSLTSHSPAEIVSPLSFPKTCSKKVGPKKEGKKESLTKGQKKKNLWWVK